MPTAISLTTPLPPADLRFDSLTYSSGLSQLEEMQVHMLSERPDLHPEDLLGHLVDVSLELRDGAQRHLGGYVSRFGMGKHQGRYYGYHATIVPWLWFLTRKSDCRIFQDMDVKEIVTKIFDGHASIANYEWKTTRMYRKRSYCVQYRETDYNFVARLMEDEGIYWYFEHSDQAPKLILVDMASAHAAVPGYEELPYFGNLGQSSPDVDLVSSWNFSREVKSGKVALTSYNFEKPGTDLKVALALQRNYALSDLELFDFQGDYTQSSDGEQLSDNRMDEVQARFETLTGTSNAYGLATGHLFTLTRHPREDQNIEVLVTQLQISAALASDESGRPDTLIECSFAAIPSAQQFRPARRTPKPFVQGPQSAVVTGPSGEEIFTDVHGRVKVKFFWDRHGQKNETSSCWLRVSHPWAGKSFGMIHIPRIGQEVIVDFLEGDPDQPLVTGRVYNADQTPPWTLPANATQSGILTRSSKGGAYGNANALRFEDKKGAEQVWLQAERNMDTMVENDQSCTVGHDQTNLIRNKQKTNVMKGREVYVEEGGETYYVKGDQRTVFVKGKQVQTVTNGYDTIVTNERGEYTKGNRKSWTSGFYQFKSTEAYFDVGPLLYVQGTDFKFKSSAGMFFEAGADINMKAANFKFAASGNFDFTGNKFNRTIFEGNDTVLGPNTNTYIGVSRETVMGPATEVYSGMKNSAAAGIAIEGFLGMQVSNFLGLAMSNAVSLDISNAGINMGITGIDLTMAGIGLDNNGFKMFNCGGGAGAGGASLSAGPTVVALMAAAAGGGFALGFGGAGTMDARSQGENDVQTLLNSPDLTPAVKARLKQALDSRFTHPTAEQYGATIPAGEVAAQTGSLAEGTPGAGAPPMAGLDGPPASPEPSPGAH
jgi:type VI secretion system secreted protein VgrG